VRHAPASGLLRGPPPRHGAVHRIWAPPLLMDVAMQQAEDGPPQAALSIDALLYGDEAQSHRVRRPPPRLCAENHVYVARRQTLAVLFKIVRKLFDRKGHSEVFVHGMGPMIAKAIHLGQDVLQCYRDEIGLEPSIGTVDVVDDLLDSFEAQERHVSSLTLRLYRLNAAAPGA